jgi:hypothetical protein
MTKTIVSTLLVALLALTAQAQYSTIDIVDGTGALSSMTNTAVAGTTVTRGVLVPKSTCGVFTSVRTTAVAGTNAIRFIFQKSYDNSTWTTALTNSVTGGGSNVVASAEAALTLADYGYLRVTTLTNTTGATITNMTVRIYHK